MQSKKQHGFSLVELMVVIAVAGILAAAAAPSFSGMINNMRQTSAVSLLTGDLNRARGEAIKRNHRVILCVRLNDTTCGTGTNWANGWLICHDDDNDGACDTAATSTDPQNPIVIAVRPPISSNLTLNSTGAAAGPIVQFNPAGTQGSTVAPTPFQFAITGGNTPITVNVAATGSITK
jgi:type IV fimbrial biogenesis protein FimT